MKKLLIPIICAAVLVAYGCTQERLGYGGGQGALTLTLSNEGTFADLPNISATSLGGQDTCGMFTGDYSVSILDQATGEVVMSWERYADMPSSVALDPASYIIVAESAGGEEPSWKGPHYRGERNITVETGRVCEVDIVCIPDNMKITALCTDYFLDVMDDYSVTVTNSCGGLIYGRQDIASIRSGYFGTAGMEVWLKGLTKEGRSVSLSFKVDNVASGDHHVFTLNYNEDHAGDYTGIAVHYFLNGTACGTFMEKAGTGQEPEDPEPDDPEPDDPEPEEPLLIVSPGIDTPAVFGHGTVPESFDLKVYAREGIASLLVDVQSSTLVDLINSLNMGLSPVFDLADMDNTETMFWGGLFGLTSADVLDATSVTLSVADFIALMPVDTHKLVVSVTDNTGSTVTETVTIIITD
ncbi:MAG TPA: DUF4493 domain-containing protein [Candidatus Coprenecus stercoripullorum]|nr:DUF4493 domain-containing protein [Candidatus Coprenecus stercoripullorum]